MHENSIMSGDCSSTRLCRSGQCWHEALEPLELLHVVILVVYAVQSGQLVFRPQKSHLRWSVLVADKVVMTGRAESLGCVQLMSRVKAAKCISYGKAAYMRDAHCQTYCEGVVCGIRLNLDYFRFDFLLALDSYSYEGA